MAHEDDKAAAVDAYLDELFGPGEEALASARDRAEAAELPEIAVSAQLGRLMHVLALTRGAARILEIGTLGGYSAIWLARALPPDGRLVTIELDPRHAEVARQSIERAGLTDRVEVRVGDGLDVLSELDDDGTGPFDLVFIDADKAPYTEYFHAALRLSAPGTLIVADNVVRSGEVAGGPSEDEAVRGAQRFLEAVAAAAAAGRVTAAVVQTVGAKGHDGMALVVVTAAGDERG